MKERTTLVIKSTSPDICGRWKKDDVECEMIDLGLQPGRYDSWIGYVLSHFDFPSYVVETLEDNNVYELRFKLDGDDVHVLKM